MRHGNRCFNWTVVRRIFAREGCREETTGTLEKTMRLQPLTYIRKTILNNRIFFRAIKGSTANFFLF